MIALALMLQDLDVRSPVDGLRDTYHACVEAEAKRQAAGIATPAEAADIALRARRRQRQAILNYRRQLVPVAMKQDDDLLRDHFQNEIARIRHAQD